MDSEEKVVTTEETEVVEEPAAVAAEPETPAPEEPVQSEEPAAVFELTSTIIEELCSKMCEVMYINKWGQEEHKYRYYDCDIDKMEVYAFDDEDGKLYGFSIIRDDDVISIDWESKKIKRLDVVDFEGEEYNSMFSNLFSEIGETTAKLSEAEKELESQKEEIESLRQYKLDREASDVFSGFHELDGLDEFEALKSEHNKFSVEELREKCFAIKGRNVVNTKYAAENSRFKLDITSPVQSEKSDPYGGIVNKYINK